MSHYAYFVVFETKTKNTEQLVSKANTILTNNGFVNEGGYFSGGKCDWFEVGGRFDTGIPELKHNAAILTSKLISKLKRKYNDTEVFDADVFEEHSVKFLDKNDVGKAIVVIDYHN